MLLAACIFCVTAVPTLVAYYLMLVLLHAGSQVAYPAIQL